MEMETLDPDTMTKTEQWDFLKETFAVMGVELTDEQLTAWEYAKEATITGENPKKVIAVSVDLLFAVFQVLDQVSTEMTKQEVAIGKLPYDGTCACPKHTWLMPAYNEIAELLNKHTIGIKDLTPEFQYGLKLMQEKQMKLMLENSERIGASKEDPYVELIDPMPVSETNVLEEDE